MTWNEYIYTLNDLPRETGVTIVDTVLFDENGRLLDGWGVLLFASVEKKQL